MDEKRANVFTIACDAPFLDVLAKQILEGFPIKGAEPNLGALKVLVPTRRAARELQIKLLAQSERGALVLPNILPIGDIDEDLLDMGEIDDRLPNAITSIGRQFMLVGLIDEWVQKNPQERLAQETANSAQQAQSLAASMGELIDSLETEEISLERLGEAYNIDLAFHQAAVLGLLDLIQKRLPAKLHEEGLMGANARRSHLIRLEADRLTSKSPKGAIIAAGSTGTIPATRALLKAIAHLENGAVILPGLDQIMDDASWNAVTSQHPQHALKQLIEDLGVDRNAVPVMGQAGGARAWVASELMRPSDVADGWQQALSGQSGRMQQGLADFALLEARDKNHEASIIALLMRHELENPSGDIALVTPDRDLARRVKASLLRWNIHVDDSAGEPLIRFGAASLMSLVMDATINNFNAPSLCALFAHPLSCFGMEREAFLDISRTIDLALFRDTPVGAGLSGLKNAFDRAALNKGKLRRHALIENLGEADWQAIGECIDHIFAMLAPLENSSANDFAYHLDTLVSVTEAVAGEAFWQGDEADALETLITALRQEAHRFPACNFNRAATAIRYQLGSVAFRGERDQGARLSILGLLEARLIRPDTIILGGLNEGKWPRQPDAGPWLNRPMRDVFAMPQPERQIGQMAHDFVQAFGAAKVYLTYPRRDGASPAIPSRWILRVETIMQAVGLTRKDEPWANWTTPSGTSGITPARKPRACPPVAARPSRLSVTRIEKLIRDPYAVYAQSVLKLDPLADVSTKPGAALRGTLFHAAIGEFFTRYPAELPEDAVAKMIALGEKHFEPFMDTPEIAGFWWSRFKRIAHWLIENELRLRGDARIIVAEVDGEMELTIAGNTFKLTARADRIDVHLDGQAHIIDFKSGTIPSADQVKAKFSPQLTLEAAMLESGAFNGLGRLQTRALTYVGISGGVPSGELKPVDVAVMDTAHAHLQSLITLLESYQIATQAYVPRFGFKSEDDVSEYDHLSRYREWILSGDTP
jgi:ATP-dependent helicase/nuclease subunit B